MQSCVKMITPGGIAGGFSDITGVNDARTGAQFSVRTVILVGGYAALDTLEYQGPDDSAYHHDFGIMQDDNSGSHGGGICHDFGIKVASTADGYGYLYMDTWPDIFFGGYIGGYGYVSNVVPGSFRINWIRRDRNADSRLMICLGDTDYDASIKVGLVNGDNVTIANPQGMINVPSGVLSGHGSGPAVTAAGGTGWEIGWAVKEALVQFAAINNSGNQNGNNRFQLPGQFSTFNSATITAFNANSVTVSASGASGGDCLFFGGDNVVCRAGNFPAPAANSNYDFNVDCNPALVFFASTGQILGAGNDSTQAAGTFGCVDPALSQGSFWTGDITVGVSPPVLLGARWLSSHYAYQSGAANGGSTTFANKMTITNLRPNGDVRANFIAADGSTPQIYWFAIGTERIPESANRGKGIYKLVPNKRQDTVWFDADSESKYLAKKPMPYGISALLGDE